MTNEHAGHRQRLRGQFLKNGPDSLYPHQLLELLLFYAIPQKDTNGLAHSLINRFGSLSAVLDASPEELMSVKGVGRNTAILIKAASEVYAEYGTASQKSIALSNRFILDAYYGSVFRPSDGEQLAVTLLDDGLSVILTKKFGYKSPLLQREAAERMIISTVVKNGGSRCIVAHYRPSGVTLRRDELENAKKLMKAVRAVCPSVEEYFIMSESEITTLKSYE